MKSGFELINEKVEEAGVQYLFQTTLQTLIVDENDMVARARFVDKDGNLVDIAAKAVALATGGALSGMGPVSNLTPRFEAGHMLGTFYPLLGLLPNGKRFYCETAVHNAATGALAAGYYEWYSVWDSVAQNGIDQEVILHAGDAVKAYPGIRGAILHCDRGSQCIDLLIFSNTTTSLRGSSKCGIQ